MKTVTGQGNGAKGFKVIGVAVTALVISAWILPSRAQMERAPVGPVHAEAEIASDVNAHGALEVAISFPAEAKIGQYCVAYGIAWGGTSPYEFSWSGQFSNADAEDGPLGPNQIASGYLSRYNRLDLTVVDAEGTTAEAESVSWDWSDEYNPDCEA